jgi:hypothetical protein
VFDVIARPLFRPLFKPLFRALSGAFNVSSLFANGEQGVWYDMLINLLFQNSAGTTPVTSAGDPTGLVLDKSGNVINGTQTVSARRPTYADTPNRLTLDGVDDGIVIQVPAGGWIGSMVLATDEGTASYRVDIPAGPYEIGGLRFPGNSINNVLIREGTVSPSALAAVESIFVTGGAKASYADVSDFNNYWRGMSEITDFPLIDTGNANTLLNAWVGCSGFSSFPLINTANVSIFQSAWFECTGLISFPLIDVSSATDCIFMFFGASSLNDFPANFFDNCLATRFNSSFDGTNLSQASIDGILVSIESNNTSNGRFDQSGGSAPSSVGEAAITALRGRGWDMAVTGGF